MIGFPVNRRLRLIVWPLAVLLLVWLVGCAQVPSSTGPNAATFPPSGSNNPASDSNDDSGPLGNNPGPDPDADNDPKIEDAKDVMKSSSSTIAQQSAAMRILIEAGVSEDELPAEVVARIKEWVRFVLSDPASTPRAWLDAFSWAESLGIKDPELMDAVKNKIKAYIEGVLTNSTLCKGRLIELAELTSTADLDALNTQIMNRAASAPLQCSWVTREWATRNYSYNHFLRVSILGGTLKEHAVFGYRNPEALTYYWSDGLLTWEFQETTRDDCATTVRTGSGSEVLDRYEDGYVGVYADGTYSGPIVDKAVMVHVTVTQTNEEGCEETAQSYDEPLGITLAFIEGTWTESGRLNGSLNDSWAAHPDTDDFTGNQKIEWDLSLPN